MKVKNLLLCLAVLASACTLSSCKKDQEKISAADAKTYIAQAQTEFEAGIKGLNTKDVHDVFDEFEKLTPEEPKQSEALNLAQPLMGLNALNNQNDDFGFDIELIVDYCSGFQRVVQYAYAQGSTSIYGIYEYNKDSTAWKFTAGGEGNITISFPYKDKLAFIEYTALKISTGENPKIDGFATVKVGSAVQSTKIFGAGFKLDEKGENTFTVTIGSDYNITLTFQNLEKDGAKTIVNFIEIKNGGKELLKQNITTLITADKKMSLFGSITICGLEFKVSVPLMNLDPTAISNQLVSLNKLMTIELLYKGDLLGSFRFTEKPPKITGSLPITFIFNDGTEEDPYTLMKDIFKYCLSIFMEPLQENGFLPKN